MWPDQVSNPGPLTYESGALPTALCGPAREMVFFHENVPVLIIRAAFKLETGLMKGYKMHFL